MKILLLCGESGTGKTTIMQKLEEKYPTLYNAVQSYTNRPQREENEYGHCFVATHQMKKLLKTEKVVARSIIDNYCYCATENQFNEQKVNIYIVDKIGQEELLRYYDTDEICTILIKRDNVDISEDRMKRELELPDIDTIDEIINNRDIDQTIDQIHYFLEVFYDI